MKAGTFSVELIANVEIHDQDFALLLQEASRHYDGTIQRSVCQGGFLYGLNNRRTFSKGKDIVCDLTGRQLDLLLKTLEQNHSDRALFLSQKLFNVLNKLTSTYKELTASLNAYIDFEKK